MPRKNDVVGGGRESMPAARDDFDKLPREGTLADVIDARFERGTPAAGGDDRIPGPERLDGFFPARCFDQRSRREALVGVAHHKNVVVNGR